MGTTDGPWDEATLEIAFDQLNELNEGGATNKANVLAARIRNAIVSDQLDLANWLNETWHCHEKACCLGVATSMLAALIEHAIRADDLGLFGRVLDANGASPQLHYYGGATLPSPFLGLAVAKAATGSTAFRHAVCCLLSEHERNRRTDIRPWGQFLFSCLDDEPASRTLDGAGVAAWLISSCILRGKDEGGGWRRELTARALAKNAPSAALAMHTYVGVIEGDPGLSELFGLRGAKLETVMKGTLLAVERKGADLTGLRLRLDPLVGPLREVGSKKLRTIVASLWEALNGA